MRQWIKFAVGAIRVLLGWIPNRNERARQLKKAINTALDQILELLGS
jgi:hypothetical protein